LIEFLEGIKVGQFRPRTCRRRNSNGGDDDDDEENVESSLKRRTDDGNVLENFPQHVERERYLGVRVKSACQENV
jgi:hypothetical protein